jgi:hypothetical protein
VSLFCVFRNFSGERLRAMPLYTKQHIIPFVFIVTLFDYYNYT